MNDSEQIKTWAYEIGFDKVGITHCGPAPGGEHLIEWLERGYYSGMNWMLRDAYRRLDPRCILPGAHSVICLGLNYFTPHHCAPSELKISRYAWGTDYHNLMGRMLKELAARIRKTWPDANLLWYADTGPVLEKSWAQQAGIGWIGKNNILVSRDFGTWLFLGEVITTLILEADTPEQDHCGSCDLCLHACPTGAIVEPYVTDPRRCISYWTIEHRGKFPAKVADSLEGWVFGCDACQEVCPFNRFQKDSNLNEYFTPREELLQPASWQGVDRNDFARLTRQSPLRRAKLEGIQRNIRAARHPAGPKAERAGESARGDGG